VINDQLIVRRRPAAPLQPFIIFGAVIANHLPTRAEVGRYVLIQKLDEDGDHILVNRPLPKLDHPQVFSQQLSVIPAHIEVRSEWSISFRVDAQNSDDAYAKVMRLYVPPVLAALVAINDDDVAINILRIGIEDERGWIDKPWSPWSPSVRLHGFDVEHMPVEDVRTTQMRAEMIMHEQSLLWASQLFCAAQKLDHLSSGLEPAVEAALLAYFKVIESISESVAKNIPSGNPDQSARIVDQLRLKLNAKSTPRIKASAIRKAAQELQQADGAYLSLRIRAAGEVLSVGEAEIAAAETLCRTRNKRLSHPGQDSDTLDGQLPPAATTARRYLAAFLRSKSN
jgi:hypothetical protein